MRSFQRSRRIFPARRGVDDRRAISRIVHVRSTIVMSAGPPQASGSICSRRSRKPAAILIEPSAVKRRRRGKKNQAVGRFRGGRATKIQALTVAVFQPIAFMPNGGDVADRTTGAQLLARLTVIMANRDTSFLELHGRQYRVSIKVPDTLRSIVGGCAVEAFSRDGQPHRGGEHGDVATHCPA